MKLFKTFRLETRCLLPFCDERFPTALYSWNENTLELPNDGTYFGFVQSGRAVLTCAAGEFNLCDKMYFCVPDDFSIAGGSGIVVTRLGFKGLFSIGGRIEETGRLRYIDGCTDTLLIAPPLLGDPCLNALYFPPNIIQTPHTHPSVRVGIVAKGKGDCLVKYPGFEEPERYLLTEGKAFFIAPETVHSFNSHDDGMVVIAYHPDSDFGATHENHPMVNRTFVGEVSAKHLDEIKTK